MLDGWVDVRWEGTDEGEGGGIRVWEWAYVGGPARTTMNHLVVGLKRG